jgi:hypothetical protein
MKMIYAFLVALFVMNGATAQTGKPCLPCMPEGITFFTQSQIDSFQINYPNCTLIEGDVTISGPGITNLNGLSELTSIGGGLNIGAPFTDLFLESLSGLENLTSIGGDLHIMASFALTNLIGLEGLTSVGGGFLVYGNHVLTTLSGLENLQSVADTMVIQQNSSLKSLTGLDNLTLIGGSLSIHQNDSLTGLTGLKSLTTLDGALNIGINSVLASLTGLENLTSIDGGLFIVQNDALTTLAGLENIESGSITGLHIIYNGTLSTCEVKSICNYLTNPNGEINIHDNASGCNSQQEVEDSCAAIGIESLHLQSSLSIYPNPTSNVITIEAPDKGTLSVLNLSGQQLLQKELTETATTVDVRGWNSGVYVVKLIGEKGVQVGKMIRQ